jgi:hypothetical protein
MMRRRQFLDATIAAGAAMVWPMWLKEAFGDPAACLSGEPSKVAATLPSAAALTQAFRDARRARRPLLVIVVPADDTEKWDRGRAWGELLNFGSDEQIASLSSVEVACSTMDALKLVVPNETRGEPFFALITTEAAPSKLRAFEVELPSYRNPVDVGKDTWEHRLAEEDQISQNRIAALAGALRSALGAPTGDVGARAADVRTRLKDGPPAGAHWARSSGCGVRVEGVSDNAVFGCGMGHVPDKSRRFLYFFSRDGR